MKDLNLVDIWRNMYPNQSSFSCYSSACQTFSRIDYYLFSANPNAYIPNSWYDSILISDHAPVSFVLKVPNLSFSSKWHLQPIWLKDPEFIQFFETKLDIYFELNTHKTLFTCLF